MDKRKIKTRTLKSRPTSRTNAILHKDDIERAKPFILKFAMMVSANDIVSAWKD